jgi:hypothetical protein
VLLRHYRQNASKYIYGYNDFKRRGFSDYHFGIPCANWLLSLMNRIDPEVLSGASGPGVADCWPGRPELVAIDSKVASWNPDYLCQMLQLTPR